MLLAIFKLNEQNWRDVEMIIENIEDIKKKLPRTQWSEKHLFLIPKIPAVYFLCTRNRILYIGGTSHLYNRMMNRSHTIRKYMNFKNLKLYWLETCYSELEREFIYKLQPLLNKQSKVGFFKLNPWLI